MHRLSRHVFRAPQLRLLAWMAWLMLAATPVFSMPSGMRAHAGGGSTMQMADHAAHGVSAAVATDCCAAPAHGHAAAGDCQCPATCAGALPALAMVALAAVPATASPASPSGASAPDAFRSPPLRPPLLQTSR